MIFSSLSSLTDEVYEKFYKEGEDGVIVIQGGITSKMVSGMLQMLQEKTFTLKDHQHINNGQSEYCFTPSDREQTSLRKILDVYRHVQTRLCVKNLGFLDCSATRYPESSCGAAFHQDFSHNRFCVVTFFLGDGEYMIASDRSGKDTKKYKVTPGDILLMRAPRDGSVEEKVRRPIHGVGTSIQEFYTIEIRNVYNNN